MNTQEKAVVTSALVKYLGVTVVTVSLLFVSAGTVAWAGAWIILGFGILYLVSVATVGMKYFPETVLGRSQTRFVHSWDKRAIIVYSLGYYTQYVISGLDFRYGWSDAGPALVAAGTLLYAAGMALTFLVLFTNPFAIGSARIQAERNHHVVSAGPYRIVRHPMYSSSILFAVGAPLILGSLWALLLSPMVIGSFVYRCAKEDAMLHDELEGYREYAAKVRYRLVPLVW